MRGQPAKSKQSKERRVCREQKVKSSHTKHNVSRETKPGSKPSKPSFNVVVQGMKLVKAF